MIHVLVVEESRRARELLVRVLSDARYAVTAARDGHVALESARRGRPDIMLLGQVTPGTSELLAARTEDPVLSGIALVMTCAHPEFLKGADVYLKEPFTLDNLLAALARCEERGRAAAEELPALRYP